MRRDESLASSRTLQRSGRDYYEYRDTATSRVAMFRPEWIKMLQVVDDDRPDDPRVQWNNGHLLHQFTYFVGEINYYYEWRQRRYGAIMSTGDSIWGLPFAPHSFAARSASEPRHILALTYGAGLVGEVQQELGILGREAARRYALPIESETAAAAALLRFHVANAGLTPEALADEAHLSCSRVSALLEGEASADREESERLAAALGVHTVHLQAVASDTRHGIRMRRTADVPRWHHPDSTAPDYLLGLLAGSRMHPFTRALELDVLRAESDRPPASLDTGLHQYVYSLGPGSAVLSW
jgi:methylphosphonate synthase